tara:strand:- start:12851 stop:16141 length:3291 start_codon:yes stop_codon:yes gene_type:complete
MAKDKVTVDVKVDDKGTTKKVGLGAQGAADGLERMGRAAQTSDRRLKGAAQTSANSTKNNAKMMQGISGGLVPAYATLAANVFALTAAFNFFKRAADVANLEKSQKSFAASTGTAMGTLTKRLQEASGGMLGFREAAAATAIGVAKGFSGKQMEDLAVGAQKASAALGVGFEDAFDRLVRGASKAEPELLDELGITLRLEEATQRYGEAIGKNAKDLTTFERSQAVLLETQRQLNEQFGEADAIQNPYVRLQKTFEEIVKQVTEFFLPAFNTLANFLAENAKLAAVIFGLLAASIIKSIPGVQELTDKVLDFGKGSSAGVMDAIDDWSAYNAKLKETKRTLADIKDKALKKTTGIAKQLVEGGSKSKIVGKVARGETLGRGDAKKLQAALDRAEAQYKKHGKIVSGIFKGEDIKRFKHFKSSFEQSQRTSRTFFQVLQSGYGKATRGTKILGKSIKTAIIAPYRLATKVARGAAKAFSMAGKATVVLAVVGTVLTGLKQMAEAPATVLKNFISFIAGIAKGVQFGVNLVIDGINALLNKLPDRVKKLIGLEEGEVFIGQVTFADGLEQRLLEMDMVAGKLKEFEKIEEANDAIKAVDKNLENLKETAETAGEDLKNALKGIAKLPAGAKRDLVKATTISTLQIAEQVKEAQDKSFSPQQRKEALENVVKGLKEEQLKALGLDIVQAIRDGNSALIEGIEIENRDFAAKTNAFSDALNNLSQLSGKTKSQQLEFLEVLRDQGIELIETAERTGKLTDAQKDLDKVFGNTGGLEAYIDRLRAARDELERIDNKLQEIALRALRREGTFLPKGYNDFLSQQDTIDKAQAEADRAMQNLRDAQADERMFQEDPGSRTKLFGGKTLDDMSDATKKAEQEADTLNAKLVKTQKEMSTIGQIGQVVTDGLYKGFEDAFAGLIDGTRSAKDAFKDMAKSMLTMIAQLISRMLVAQALTALLGGFMGASASPSLGMTDMPQLDPGLMYARGGGIFEPDHGRGYRRGGIARGRDAGYPAMLHGTEAVIPLGQNKHIPVEMKGGGGMGTQNNVSINVNIDKNGNSDETSTSDSTQGETLGKAVSRAVQEELQYQKRSGGILNPYGVS